MQFSSPKIKNIYIYIFHEMKSFSYISGNITFQGRTFQVKKQKTHSKKIYCISENGNFCPQP